MNVRFGEFQFDSGTRLLSRGTEPVHLTPKALKLLKLLLEQRPNAVSKDDIQARLWPETFVSEASLQGLISEVRDALDDDARHVRFVRTVHGFGYAFIGVTKDAPSATAGRSPARAWLTGDAGRLQLVEGENILGRSGAGVIPLESPTVSRRHARLVIGEDARIEDLGSKNGTFVNDNRADEPIQLSDGDRIRIGVFLLTFRLELDAESTQTASAVRT
jgi:DNA-binding winged helix-turn-helix (wHTH) protein